MFPWKTYAKKKWVFDKTGGTRRVKVGPGDPYGHFHVCVSCGM